MPRPILAQSSKHDSVSDEHQNLAQILANTHAVIFAGTPHAGSIHSKWRHLIPFALHMATKGVGALVATLAAAFWIGGVGLASVSLLGKTWQVTLGGFSVGLLTLILATVLGSRLRRVAMF